MKLTKLVRRWLRFTAPLAALVAVCTVAAPAWAGTVQIQDDAHVLTVTTVQSDAATLPVGVYIWTTTQDAASKPAFDTDVRNKISAIRGWHGRLRRSRLAGASFRSLC